VIEYGLSVANTYLNPGFTSAGDEWNMRIAMEAAGGNDQLIVSIQQSPGWANLASLTPAEAGWDGAGGSDLETDNLRIAFNVRKTRVDKSYAISADFINVDTAVTNLGGSVLQTVSNAYNAATLDYFVIQHDGSASTTIPAERFDATIDALRLEVSEDVAPVLVAPVVSALGLDGLVGLNWGAVLEADSYDVTASTTGSNGVYSVVSGGSGLTTNAFVVTGLSNGVEYWFKVTATALNAADAVSSPVSAVPESVTVNGVILNTTFTNQLLYSNGDLAGQDRWQAIAASSPNAFEVDVNGAGFADSEPYAAFATNGGNHVVYNRLIDNGVGSVWSGSVAFTLGAAADGSTVTKVVEGVTNVATIASLSGAEEFFRFGLSSDTDNSDVDPAAEDDMVWVVRNDASDQVGIGLNMYQYNINTSLQLTREQLGWDPLWEDAASTGPDFETDQITLDYSIRKSTATDIYTGQVIAHIGGNSYTGTVVSTLLTQSQPVDAYAADTVKFVMGHRVPVGQQLFVAVDSVSMVHTNASAVPQIAPDLTGSQGIESLSIELSWIGAPEADSYKIYRSESYGTLGTEIADVTALSYTDSASLQDKTAYMYTVAAVYGGSEAFSDQVVVWALAKNAPLWYPGKTSGVDWLGAHQPLDGDVETPVAGNGFTLFISGAGATHPDSLPGDKSIFADSDIEPSGVLIDLCPLVYMVAQVQSVDGVMRGNDGGGTQPTIRYLLSDYSTLFYVDNNIGYTGGEFDATQVDPIVDFYVGGTPVLKIGTTEEGYAHVAIRNDTQWYVCTNQYFRNQKGQLNIMNAYWAPLTLATATDTNRMTIVGETPVLGSDLSLTKLNAVGWFWDNMTKNPAIGSGWQYLDRIKVEYGSQPSAYQNWAAGYNVYNADAAPNNDYDGDGVDNITEWGLGGNLSDPGNTGIQERRHAMDGSGNFLYIYPRMTSTPRPTYSIGQSTDLVYTPFSALVKDVDFIETAGGQWETTGTGSGFEAVTNEILSTSAEDVQFFKLMITE